MVKAVTTHDSTLQEKIFIIKGEESYARTTDCILEEILDNGERRDDWNTHKEYMLLEFRIDVLRDIGASNLVLYDNDDVIGVYDFDTNTHYIEFIYNLDPDLDSRLKFNYGVEHRLYARYMGNKKCLKSTSKSYSFYEPIPERFDSSISFSGLSTNYDTGDNVEFDAVLSAYNVSSQSLTVYVDGTAYDTYTTDSEGVASVSITDLTDGKHSIIVRFDGNQYSTATSNSQDISVGYLLDITNHSQYVINDSVSDAQVYAYDYLGEPALKSVTIQEYTDGVGWADVSLSVMTGSDGYAYLDSVYLTDKPFRADVDNQYHSESYTIPKYNNVTVSMNIPNPVMVSTNYSSILTGSVTNVTAPVKVSINQGVGNVMTDSNGNFTATYNGSGGGDTTITASVYGSSASVSIEDVIQYWKANGTSYNRGFRIRVGEMTSLTNGWKFYNSSQPVVTYENWIGGNFYPVYYSPLIIQYKIVSTSTSSVTFHCGRHFDDNISVSGVKAGDIVKITMDSNKVAKLYLNDTLKGTFAENVYEAGYIGFILPSNNNIIINEVKLKRWNDE